jgi:polysaccharide deacetylase 2 family uncharacterized protein YibQ
VLDVLKEHANPYFSFRVFSLTLAGLVTLSALTAAIIAFRAHPSETVISVTIPLGGENVAEDIPHPVTAGELTADDLGGPEAEPSAPKVEETPRPAVEDAVAGLHENTPFGLVPVIRKPDGLTAFKAYRSKFSPAASTKALISLVMVDYGLSPKLSAQAIGDLPKGVTLALSPYSQDAQKWVTDARQDGHEVWLGLPLQGSDFGLSDSGPQTILVNASVEQNKGRLLSNLGKATGYAGVITPGTSAFSNNASDLDRIYSDIMERGLALVQTHPKDTLTGEFAITHKAPFIQNDLWIDLNATPAAVMLELEKLKQMASYGRVAVGFFHPYPSVIAAVKDWQDELKNSNIELAPLSASIEQK